MTTLTTHRPYSQLTDAELETARATLAAELEKRGRGHALDALVGRLALAGDGSALLGTTVPELEGERPNAAQYRGAIMQRDLDQRWVATREMFLPIADALDTPAADSVIAARKAQLAELERQVQQSISAERDRARQAEQASAAWQKRREAWLSHPQRARELLYVFAAPDPKAAALALAREIKADPARAPASPPSWWTPGAPSLIPTLALVMSASDPQAAPGEEAATRKPSPHAQRIAELREQVARRDAELRAVPHE